MPGTRDKDQIYIEHTHTHTQSLARSQAVVWELSILESGAVAT